MIPSVVDAPRFLENITVFEKCIGENTSILCSVVGNPLPDVSLYLNEILLASNVKSLSYHVAIDSTSRFGTYVCNSNNSLGTDTITTTITVKRKLIYGLCLIMFLYLILPLL